MSSYMKWGLGPIAIPLTVFVCATLPEGAAEPFESYQSDGLATSPTLFQPSASPPATPTREPSLAKDQVRPGLRAYAAGLSQKGSAKLGTGGLEYVSQGFQTWVVLWKFYAGTTLLKRLDGTLRPALELGVAPNFSFASKWHLEPRAGIENIPIPENSTRGIIDQSGLQAGITVLHGSTFVGYRRLFSTDTIDEVCAGLEFAL